VQRDADIEVTDTSTQYERKLGDRPQQIPHFEGEEVVATKGKITSVAGLEIEDRVFRLDESVKLVVEARVVGIEHKPNNAGKLERVHTLKAIDSLVVDWALDMDALREALQ
jgi:hypothetical protein